ncbi:hypothetical protein ACSNOI_42665, partial [Actinomadura kijaniata]|uniref:hypothetical protein n=1 Tax=Actinomadura kijaniata TaxID=46161 RepID=UPI003F1B39D8
AADRLLLGELHKATPDRTGSGDRIPAGEGERTVIALTYGHRPARNGTATWYTHAFTWTRPDRVATDR